MKSALHKLQQCIDRLNPFWFCLRSYFKQTWEFADYPVTVRAVKNPAPDVCPYMARILGWWVIVAGGDTPEEAYKKCQERFNTVRQYRATLPRPGTEVPIEWAPSYRLNYVPKDLVTDFTTHVLGMPWVLITDNSTLSDFAPRLDSFQYALRIQNRYGVNIVKLPDDRLVTILETIFRSDC